MAFTLTLALSLLGGLLVARSAQRRLADLNRTTRQIMAGDLSRRAPVTGSNDEHDELAANINAMLDQISNLLEGMRHVGDSVAHDLRGPLTRLTQSPRDACRAPSDRRVVRTSPNAFASRARARHVQCAAADRARRIGRASERVRPCRSRPHRTRRRRALSGRGDERRITLTCECRAASRYSATGSCSHSALTNLLDNAVKYTPLGRRVSHRPRAHGRHGA